MNEVLSDQENGGFYASQDADYSLDDDGDYFTWTLDELRAALAPDEARVMELYYDVEAHGEMHHNPAKNVLWIARDAAEIARQLEPRRTDGRHHHRCGKRKNAGRAPSAPHSLRRQDHVRFLERDVRFGVSRRGSRSGWRRGRELPRASL